MKKHRIALIVLCVVSLVAGGFAFWRSSVSRTAMLTDFDQPIADADNYTGDIRNDKLSGLGASEDVDENTLKDNQEEQNEEQQGDVEDINDDGEKSALATGTTADIGTGEENNDTDTIEDTEDQVAPASGDGDAEVDSGSILNEDHNAAPQPVVEALSLEELQSQLVSQFMIQDASVASFYEDLEAFESSFAYEITSDMEEMSFDVLMKGTTYVYEGEGEGTMSVDMTMNSLEKDELNTSFTASIKYTFLQKVFYMMIESLIPELPSDEEGTQLDMSMIDEMFGGTRIELPLDSMDQTGLPIPGLQHVGHANLTDVKEGARDLPYDLIELLPRYSIFEEKMSTDSTSLVDVNIDQLHRLRVDLAEQNPYITFRENSLKIKKKEGLERKTMSISEWLGTLEETYAISAQLSHGENGDITFETTLITHNEKQQEIPVTVVFSDGKIEGKAPLENSIDMTLTANRMRHGKRSIQFRIGNPEVLQSITFVGILEQSVAQDEMKQTGKGVMHIEDPDVQKLSSDMDRLEVDFSFTSVLKKVPIRNVTKPVGAKSVEELFGGMMGIMMGGLGANGPAGMMDMQVGSEVMGGETYNIDEAGFHREETGGLERPDESGDWSDREQIDYEQFLEMQNG